MGLRVLFVCDLWEIESQNKEIRNICACAIVDRGLSTNGSESEGGLSNQTTLYDEGIQH